MRFRLRFGSVPLWKPNHQSQSVRVRHNNMLSLFYVWSLLKPHTRVWHTDKHTLVHRQSWMCVCLTVRPRALSEMTVVGAAEPSSSSGNSEGEPSACYIPLQRTDVRQKHPPPQQQLNHASTAPRPMVKNRFSDKCLFPQRHLSSFYFADWLTFHFALCTLQI